ncbi:response regulator transcription factor [Lentzea jiangxiensis]|uniref:Regulatory protein, luxR family n=1 Tax=Lentzea jiangxiensis TaxID=641025 RepID=A0A1H0GZC1_9PSEU|nr:helix-turn-helix transcriptional regulator [Lentzea jiangxiensis]SDO12210.1 regulatory protein, luxR family [Lentzea jiangxiensis]
MKLAAIGRTNAEIARKLFISVGTVETHLTSVQTKLDAGNRIDIADWAWQTRLVDHKQDPQPVCGQKPRRPPPEFAQ